MPSVIFFVLLSVGTINQKLETRNKTKNGKNEKTVGSLPHHGSRRNAAGGTGHLRHPSEERRRPGGFAQRLPQFDKVDVNGPQASPLFTFLKSKQPFRGFNTADPTGKMMDNMLRKQDAAYDKKSDIKWNFTKFLVSRDGRVIARYEPTATVKDMELDIRTQLLTK